MGMEEDVDDEDDELKSMLDDPNVDDVDNVDDNDSEDLVPDECARLIATEKEQGNTLPIWDIDEDEENGEEVEGIAESSEEEEEAILEVATTGEKDVR